MLLNVKKVTLLIKIKQCNWNMLLNVEKVTLLIEIKQCKWNMLLNVENYFINWNIAI